MPQIIISKIKVRRGTESQIKDTVFDQGELVSSTDTKRLYIGTGTTFGGFVVGNKVHFPVSTVSSLTSYTAELGDIVNVNSLWYQLTAIPSTTITSWGYVGNRINSDTFEYATGNTISLKSNSISASYLNTSTISTPLSVSGDNLTLQYQTKSFDLSSNKLSLKAAGIDEREIASASFGDGITGGSGTKISLKYDPAVFNYSIAGLTLSSIPTAIVNDAGNGLVYNSTTSKLSAYLTNVDGESLVRTASTGVIGINTANVANSGTNEWGQIVIDEFGRVVDNSSSIYGTLTGNASLSGFNATSPLSAIFNGSPSGGAFENTFYSAVSSNGSVITLSSAGFITFEGNVSTRDGSTVGRFAIPIFSY